MKSSKMIWMLALSGAMMFSCGQAGEEKDEKAGDKSQVEENKPLDKEELATKIEEIAKLVEIDATLKSNKKEAQNFVALAKEFVFRFPKDPRSPDFLFKAAGVSAGLQEHIHAVSTYERFIATFPDHRLAQLAQFSIGTIYEQDLKEFGKATEAYQKLVDNYPGSNLAETAQLQIEYLKIDPKEITRRLKAGEPVLDSVVEYGEKGS